MSTKNELALENETLRAHVAELKAEISRIVNTYGPGFSEDEDVYVLWAAERALLDKLKARNTPKPVYVPRARSAAEIAADDAWKARMAAARELAMSSGKSVLL